MSSSPAPVVSPIDQLRARLDRLASDPRVRFVPDGAAIVLELRAALDVLERVTTFEKRLASLEGALASLVRIEEKTCDD